MFRPVNKEALQRYQSELVCMDIWRTVTQIETIARLHGEPHGDPDYRILAEGSVEIVTLTDEARKKAPEHLKQLPKGKALVLTTITPLPGSIFSQIENQITPTGTQLWVQFQSDHSWFKTDRSKDAADLKIVADACISVLNLLPQYPQSSTSTTS